MSLKGQLFVSSNCLVIEFVNRVRKPCSGCGRRTTWRRRWMTCRERGRARRGRWRPWRMCSPLAAWGGSSWLCASPALVFSSVESTPYAQLSLSQRRSLTSMSYLTASWIPFSHAVVFLHFWHLPWVQSARGPDVLPLHRCRSNRTHCCIAECKHLFRTSS